MLRISLIFTFCLLVAVPALSQEKQEITRHRFKFGPKVGFQVYQPIFREYELPEEFNNNFDFGYNIGGVMDYKVTDRFAVHTELSYTKKGKNITGGGRDLFKNKATYHFIEVPVLIRAIYEQYGWSWYWNLGGNLSYWLGGSGDLYSFEIYDAGIREDQSYDVVFAPPKPGFQPELVLNVVEPNRVQVGLDVGFGFYFKVYKNQYLNLDFRFTYGHSWMASDEPPNPLRDMPNLGLQEYQEDLRHSIGVLAVNLAYVFDFDPHLRSQGRSMRRK